jgi:hypothetical protein
MERPRKMNQYDATILDMQRTIDQLRAEKDEWRTVAQSALAQVETWKEFCDTWQKLYDLAMRNQS